MTLKLFAAAACAAVALIGTATRAEAMTFTDAPLDTSNIVDNRGLCLWVPSN